MKTARVQTLSEWLEIATKRRSVPARRRISIEIKAHYAESIKALLAEGMSEPEAHAAGLKALGDARTANRRFRKSHLSKWEEKMIQHCVQMASAPSAIMYFGVFAFLMVISFLLSNHSGIFIFLALAFGFLVVQPAVGLFLMRRDATRRNFRAVLLLQLFGGNGWGMGGIIMFWPASSQSRYDWFELIWLALFIANFFSCFRLWKRLGMVTDSSREISRAKARTQLYIDFLLDR